MAETSKKSTTKNKVATAKKSTSKKTTASAAKKTSTAKPATKKTTTVKTTTKKEVKPVANVEVKKEVKTVSPVATASTKNSDSKDYISTIPDRIKENSILIILTVIVGVLIGMGLLALLGFRRIPKLKNGTEVIVSLKGNNITADDLYGELKEGYGLTLLLDKIDSIILENKYPDNEEITNYIDSQVNYLKTTYGDQFEDYIKYYGFDSEEKVREYFSLNYKRNLALLEYAKGLVTDDEVQKYYDEKVFGDIEASHILIKYTKDDEESKKAALTKAQNLIKQLNSAKDIPAKFAELAKANSEDTTNNSNGGTLGYFGVGEMEEAFEEAAKKLEVGKYTTTPVETSYGYHIILKTNQKEKTAIKEMKDSITETLAESKLTSDTTTQYKALESMRNENKVSFKDAALRKSYEEYLADLYKSLETENK